MRLDSYGVISRFAMACFIFAYCHSALLAKPAKETSNRAQATVTSALSAIAGNKLKIKWTGPAGKYDQIRIVSEKEPAKSLAYAYVRMSQNGLVMLNLPAKPGLYEIHYIGKDEKILAKTIVMATPVSASLSLSESVISGAPVTVRWKGPMNQYDRIRLLSIERPDQSLPYIYVAAHKNYIARLTAPETPGSYVIQYVASDKTVLAHKMFRVSQAQVKLQHDAVATAGGKLQVKWTGNVYQYDQIKLVALNDYKKTYSYLYVTNHDNYAAELTMPEQAGTYQLIYMTRGKVVLAKAVITVKVAQARFKLLSPVKPGSAFKVDWEGPANQYDQIRIIRKYSKLGSKSISRISVRLPFVFVKLYSGRDVEFIAPQQAGDYEIQYMTRLNKCLARTPLIVKE